MRVGVVGGGPGGLYLALLIKKAVPDHEVVVFERNPEGATYGWGVVFSDRTLTSFREADYKTYEQIIDNFIIWDSIDVCYRDEVVRCGGQGFSGISRRFLLGLLHRRCDELGVQIEHEREIHALDQLEGFDLVVGADGVRSVVREAHVDAFRPRFSSGRSRYIWFGTERAFDSFTFAFRGNEDGFFQAHAYPFDGSMSTFIVECDEASWRNASLDTADEASSIAYCEELFAPELRGHPLMSNNSKWINFVTLKNAAWHHGNRVLLGDAAHTAHFSIGSGTKLAMEDSIALVNALQVRGDVESALVEYQLDRKPRVERFQEAARQSQTYFENTRRYQHMEPLQFAFHLLSRSGRIDYDDLRMRDRHFVAAVDRWFIGGDGGLTIAAPPAFAPLTVGTLRLPNRIAAVAPPGAGGLETAAASGAGLVFTGMVAVSEHGRIGLGTPGIYDDTQEEIWKAELARLRSASFTEDLGNSGASGPRATWTTDRLSPAAGISLGHSGPRGATRDRARIVDVPLPEDERWVLLAASAIPYTPGSDVPAAMDRAHMDDVTEDFVAAAARAASAGFDMVELHMGHGYLLATFLSPLTNLRGDGYGGDIHARLCYPLEVLDAVRAEWPAERPLGIALTANDWAPGGLKLADAVTAAREFKDHGCDVIRVLAGQTTARYRPRYDPYFLTHYADRLRNEARVATIATGDITTVDHANTIVAGGRADICLLRTG